VKALPSLTQAVPLKSVSIFIKRHFALGLGGDKLANGNKQK